jgi:hypothetical protein
MAKREDILHRWDFPHWQRHGVTLVARENALACVERILETGCRFYGYDSFIVSQDTIQPVMDFSPDWSRGPVPSLGELRMQLASHPGEITHYEFVFEDLT